MGQEGVNKGAEPVQTQKTEVVLESLGYLLGNVSSLRNRIHSTCERVGVTFDPKDDVKELPPCYGSLPQIHDKVGNTSRVIAECHELMIELEKFV
jgi:hypothetical protein